MRSSKIPRSLELLKTSNILTGDRTSHPRRLEPLTDEHGNLIGTVLVFRDISERRLSERRLLEAAATLRSSNDELQHFVNSAAHELRSRLSAIWGMAELLSWKFSEELRSEGEEILNYIVKGATGWHSFWKTCFPLLVQVTSTRTLPRLCLYASTD